MSNYMPIYPTTYGSRYGQPYVQQPTMQQPMMQPQLQQPPVPQMQSNYICRPVASEEEARAVPTDFTGATLVLLDSAHGSIYTKSLNPMDGTAMFATYRYTEPAPPVQEKQIAYAPMEDVERLRQEVAELRGLLQRKPANKGGTVND